jgi:hypothetical protein
MTPSLYCGATLPHCYSGILSSIELGKCSLRVDCIRRATNNLYILASNLSGTFVSQSGSHQLSQ